MSKPIETIQEVEEVKLKSNSGPWTETWKAFRKNKLAVVGMILVMFFILLAIFAPFIAKEGINEQVMTDRLQAPSAEYWLGTDDYGRDILSRIIYGARISLRSEERSVGKENYCS